MKKFILILLGIICCFFVYSQDQQITVKKKEIDKSLLMIRANSRDMGPIRRNNMHIRINNRRNIALMQQNQAQIRRQNAMRSNNQAIQKRKKTAAQKRMMQKRLIQQRAAQQRRRTQRR